MLEHYENNTEIGALYEIFAFCYLQQPTMESVGHIPHLLKEAQKQFPEIELNKLTKEAEERQSLVENREEEIELLQQQYYDHFFIPSTKNYIPMFESSLRGAVKGDDRRKRRSAGGWKYSELWGKETNHVAGCYQTLGFDTFRLNLYEPLKNCKVPDHLGFELAFMSYLYQQESLLSPEEKEEALKDPTSLRKKKDRWRRLQLQFLEEHLKPFVVKYNTIAKEKVDPYYQGLAQSIESLVNWDHNRKEN